MLFLSIQLLYLDNKFSSFQLIFRCVTFINMNVEWIPHLNPASNYINDALFIHSGYFYSASSSPLLLRGAPDTARILCRCFMPKRHRQL